MEGGDVITELSASQLIMHQDGLPLVYLLPKPNRPEPLVWTRSFKEPVKRDLEPGVALFQPAKEIARDRKTKPKKEYPKQDLRGKRWCPRRNKFVVDFYFNSNQATSQESTEMKKWKITCYNAANEIITRGSTSCSEDTGQVELFAKMGAAFHRCAAGTVQKIIVTNDTDEQVRIWEKGENAEFPKPDVYSKKDIPPRIATKAAAEESDDEEEVAEVDKKTKKTKPKANGKAVKTKAAKPEPKAAAGKKNAGGIKKVGVIDTIVATMKNKDGASIEEIVAVLKKKFPDRDEKGMTSTARIQANRHSKNKEKDDVRGLLYFA